MTKEQFSKILERTLTNNDIIIYNNLIELFPLYGIDTIEEKSHYLSQMKHESANFLKFSENLNYSEKRLLEVFPKYFNKISARDYANKPIKIANRVYANRFGNADENSGDGWKYRGRGLIGLTFKTNYSDCSKDLGVDILNNPDFASNIDMSVSISLWYWKKKDINSVIKNNPYTIGDINKSIEKVTLKINGGKNGLDDRIDFFKKVYGVLNSRS